MRKREIRAIKRAFERKLRTDSVMRRRFEAGYEEAKHGGGRTYTLAEIRQMLGDGHE